ncbi:hypothetical protein [Pseudorhodoplanes sinuspersici]|uniref:Uncharacterized protein n=1 Tax=Pseudorhodoplanes sinuspersici TaxID=1235591 RepID=A0A1W6ZU85_9HYPH|nr:hypothetical protein [Pseudorhodoplanes sinuspersici]ARQ00989.1 hypothetical protein CAK95_19235 [Pseudorhodoplanes sinuspersici]RKE72626.1 hypothetical protein DFP91_0494 [Pseudorhodoplanes sinuspersici]
MSTAIGTNLTSLFSSAGRGYTIPAAPSLAQILTDEDKKKTSSSPSTIISLSDEAKAYLAQTSQPANSDAMPLETLATNARNWFDQQYEKLGISSAILDGAVAVDFSSQSRATLSAIVSNAQKLFSKDEVKAAQSALQGRFDDAMAHHVVIARHSGDYASLYDAALAYMDEAGADERNTASWQAQRKALVDGAAAARKTFGKAPNTGNSDDPVQVLLAKTSEMNSPSSGASSGSIAARARALLDDQINAAADKGSELVFNARRTFGQQVDFSKFDNRMLATVSLNQDATFSIDEARAAKAELNQRNRLSLLNAINSGNSSDPSAGSLAMIKQYAAMSAEEKSVLGVTEQVMNRLVRGYNSLLSVQSSFSNSGTTGISAYL